jgi:hypothetical protein
MLTSHLSLFRAGAFHFSSYTFLPKGHSCLNRLMIKIKVSRRKLTVG